MDTQQAYKSHQIGITFQNGTVTLNTEKQKTETPELLSSWVHSWKAIKEIHLQVTHTHK